MASPSLPLHVNHVQPENVWLRSVLKIWNAHPISTIPCLHKVGKGIFETLLNWPNPLPPVPNDESTIKIHGKPTRGAMDPTLSLVLEDMLQGKDCNVSEFISRVAEPSISPAKVIASMMNPSTLCDMSTPDRRLYGALDIVCSPTGLGSCKFRAAEYETSTKNWIPNKSWTTALTPPGAITHTHMDYYGRNQYMVHLFGHKIWLLWPPTEKNLKIFGLYHTQLPDSDTTSRCMQELEGLQIFYAKEEQAFVLQPNVLHACICLGTSAHSGTWVWMLQDIGKSLRLVKWGLDWIMKSYGREATTAGLGSEVDIIQSEVDVWRILLSENPTDVDSLAAKEAMEEVENYLQEVKKQLGLKGKKRKRGEK